MPVVRTKLQVKPCMGPTVRANSARIIGRRGSELTGSKLWQRIGDFDARQYCAAMRAVCYLAVCCAVALSVPGTALAQDVPFNPRFDGTNERKQKSATPTPDESAKQTSIYSFGRFASTFKAMCDGLAIDRRRGRVFDVATVGLREEVSCASCRAFYRQLVQSCAPPRQKKPEVTPLASPPGEDVAAEAGADQGQQATPSPTPTATPTPQPDRYPSTEVIDAASRLGIGLYDMEPGEGSPFKAVRAFETRLLGQKDLTAGERDYFGVLLSYLLAAWQGREQELLKPKPPTRDDIADLFQ